MNDPDLETSDILALDRTRMAAERTLMAWVRTALSMIGFGFTIYKFLQVVQEQSTLPVLRPQAPRTWDLRSPASEPLQSSSPVFNTGNT